MKIFEVVEDIVVTYQQYSGCRIVASPNNGNTTRINSFLQVIANH